MSFSMFLGHFSQLEADQFVATLLETRDDVGDEPALDTYSMFLCDRVFKCMEM